VQSSTDKKPQNIVSSLGSLLLRNLCFAFILGNIALFGKTMIYNAYTPDLPWIIASGQYILSHHHLPQFDIFSWSFPHQTWILYQWLFETLVALIHGSIGEQAMLRGFTVFVLGLYVILPLFQAPSRKIPLLFTLFIGSMALLTATLNISLRPMVVTTLFLGIQYLLIQRYRLGKCSAKYLFPLFAMIYLLWSNMHTGVVLGLLSLLIMAVGDFIETKRWYPVSSVLTEAAEKPLRFQFYALLLGICFLSSLINPYGFGIYTYIAHLSMQGDLNNTIMELQSPDFHLLNTSYFVILFGLFLLLMTRPRRVFSVQEILHLLLFSMVTLYAQRFMVWSALFYALILPKALYLWCEDIKNQHPTPVAWIDRFAFYRPLCTMLLLLSIGLFLFFPTVLSKKSIMMSHGACEPLLSGIKTYQTMLKHPSDRTFLDSDIGSCTLIRYPYEKVFFDTRFDVYTPTFTRQNREVMNLTRDWKSYSQHWQINTVMLTKQWALAHLFETQSAYQKIYEDPEVVIFRKQEIGALQ
jgi:hypothetical protein